NLKGVEITEAMDATEIQGAHGIFPYGTVAELGPVQAVGFLELHHVAAKWIYFSQSAVRAYPDVAAFVGGDGVDGVIGQPVSGRDMLESRLVVIGPFQCQPVEPKAGADPKAVIGVAV